VGGGRRLRGGGGLGDNRAMPSRRVVLALVAGGLLAWAGSVAAQRPAAPSVATRLRQAHEQYLEARAARDVARLATIDGDLRAVMAIRPSVRYGAFRSGYEVLGLRRMPFEAELLAYDGAVLREAHAIDPHSSARPFTLFSTIFPDGEAAVDVPDLAAARAYLREFPEGPFAADVHILLGDFFDDLYKAIRAGEALADYKRACFGRFVTAAPVEAQLEAAHRLGVAHYRRGLALRPRDDRARQAMRALADGTTNGWHFCAD
jgi:hypothetical protein